MKDLKIAVAGTGYVGLSIATLLSQHHQVTAVDVIPEKVDMLNRKQSPIQDEYIEKYLSEKALNLTATLDGAKAYSDADFVVIAAPTNYDPVKNYFDTHHIEDVIDLVLSVNPDAVMVIKSTIPVGYCRGLYLKYARKGVKKFNLLFSPEFLRESMALYDNLYPSRIIVGYPKFIESEQFKEENEAIKAVADIPALEKAARTFAALLQEGAIKEGIPTLFMGLKEAEAVKLFANTYLALRVSYFNELDTYAEMKEAACVVCRAARIRKDAGIMMKMALKDMLTEGSAEMCFELGEYFHERGDDSEASLWYYNAMHEAPSILNVHTSTDWPEKRLAEIEK